MRRIHPHATTVLGGIHGTFMYGQVLGECPEIDYIVRGEGEEVVVNLVRALAEGRLPAERERVKGIAFLRDGVPFATTPHPPIQDLDALTPDWAILDWSKYIYIPLNCRVAIPNFARGCPFTCSFCSQWKFWRTYRTRDPKKFVDEIEYLVKEHQVGFFILADEEPTINRKKFVALCEAAHRARPRHHLGHQHARHRHPARRGAAAALPQGRPRARVARHRGGGAAQARPLQQGDQGRAVARRPSSCCATPAS